LWSAAPPSPLAYDATRVTRDIDATFVPHGVVIEEARRVADDLGLPYWWLNEQASIYISGKDDPGKRRVFDHPRAARGGGLAGPYFRHEGIRRQDTRHRRSSPIGGHHRGGINDEALQICVDFYPDEPLPQRSVAVLRELFG
jgi:hypothetical protein